MKNENENVKEAYEDARVVRSEYQSRWRDIGRHCGITVDEQFFESAESHSPSDNLDDDIEDPTAALAVIQSGDYLDGIMWGTGEEALDLEPSDWVLERADKATLKDYFAYRTKQLLGNMNHNSAGFSAARKPYFYGQSSFGTSGVGVFKNGDFPEKEENPYFFRSFGIDNMAIAEGKNGLVNTIFLVYHWRVTQIMQEFDYNKKIIPAEIQSDYKNGDYNKRYTIIQAIIPRKDYQRGLKGKRGTKYRGAWFLSKNKETIFFNEDFKCLPVGVCRAIKVHGEAWGRSSGTLLISTIKSANYMLSQAIETIEKMNDPAMGTFNNALFGDSVVDTGSGGMVTFNDAMQSNKGVPPLFKLYDTGDPTALVSFLLPYLNNKIATGFKVDILLDFASQKDMTATESMQRYAIRGKSLSGLLGQQKSEMLNVVVVRCIQIEDDNGLRGIDPSDAAQVKEKADIDRSDMVIPEAVLAAMQAGKKWYKISYNNELERMTKTEGLDRIIQLVQGVTMLLALNPGLTAAVEWYDLYNDINEALGVSYIKTADEFKDAVEKQAEIQRKAMMLAAAKEGAGIQGQLSKAGKDDADAER